MALDHRRQMLAWAVATALGAPIALPAMAQNTATDGTAGGSAPPTLSTIVVRAQKRAEYMQNVPITMVTLNTQQLHDAGVHTIKDLQMVVPDLFVSSSDNSANTTARIRGIGTIGDNAGLESTVGIVIDGVPRVRNGVAFGDLGEIDSIEVLDGPQGTVFGKNTAAGVINITTKRPTFHQEGYADFTVGNYNERGVDASYSNALSNDVAFRLYVVDRKHDGYNDVFVGGGPRTLTKDDDQDFYSLRGQLLIKPTDALNIRIIGDYTLHHENCCLGVTTIRNPGIAQLLDAFAGGPGLGLIPAADPSRRLAYANDSDAEKIIDEGVSTEINWMTPWLDNANLTSITGVRKYVLTAASDLDFSAANLAIHDNSPDNGERFNTFTQELRLAGTSGPVDWLGGLYFDDVRAQRTEKITEEAQYEGFLSTLMLSGIAGALPFPIDMSNPQTFISQVTGLPYGASYTGIAQQDMYNQDSKSDAVFSNLTWHATDALALTAGARFTHEEKTTDFFYSNPNQGIGCGAALTTNGVASALTARGIPGSVVPLVAPTVIGTMCLPWENPLFNGLAASNKLSENEWSGTAKAAYRWSPRILTYLSAARGYTAGGFNLARVQSATGAVNGGSGVLPVTNTQFPAEFVDSYELGAKTTWAGGNLLLNAALFDSKFTDYQLNLFSGISWNVDTIPELTTKGLNASLLWQTRIPGLTLDSAAAYTDARYGNQPLADPVLAQLPGSVASYAPKWTGSAGFAYHWNFSDSLTGRFNFNAKYTSDYNASGLPGAQYTQDAYTLLDAGLTVGGGHWNIEFWGHNLSNRTYAQVTYPPALQTGSVAAFLGAPRTYGVTLHLAL